MTIKKWHWALVTIVTLAIVLILLTGTGDTGNGITKTVTIVSVSRQSEDGMIHLSGKTSLPVGSGILYEIWPADITTRKNTADEIVGISGTSITSGTKESAVWSADLNLASWNNRKYIINAWPEQSDPRYGDRKIFFIPLNDTISNGAGRDAGDGGIILNDLSLSEMSPVPISVTPARTPEQKITGNSFLVDDLQPRDQKVIDVHFEVQEWNLIYLHNKTIIHVTYDELKDFPDFERSVHGVTNGPGTWSYGHRIISGFDGNESDYIRFHQAVCKNLTRVECYPNPGVYEYHEQYYMIFSDRIGSHTLAGCERGNYNCTNLTT